MNLKTKSDHIRKLIENLKLPHSSSLSDPETHLGKDATGSPEYVHTFRHEIEGEAVQVFRVYVFEKGVTVQYENSISHLLPLGGSNQVEEALEDIRKFLKSGYDRAMGQETERRRDYGIAT